MLRTDVSNYVVIMVCGNAATLGFHNMPDSMRLAGDAFFHAYTDTAVLWYV